MIGRLLIACCLLVPMGVLAQVPQNLTATGGDADVALTWEGPTVENDERLLCHRVYRDTSSIPDDPEGQAEKRIAELDATGQGPFEYTDSDVTNDTRYFYRVTAEIGETGDGAISCGGSEAEESEFSNEATATPRAPVALQVMKPGTPVSDPVEAGTPVEVVVNGANVPSGEAVRLRYRQGGEQGFAVETMSATGTEFTASIPSDQVTARGAEFIVATRNERGDPVREPTDGVFSVRVEGQTQSLPQPGGMSPEAYRMVSFPIRPDDPELSNLFARLAPYDPAEWRLFGIGRAEASSSDDLYAEQNDLSASLETGRGLWLISRSNTTLRPVEGTSIRTDRAFEIPLREGWNLIGTPFAFDVPVSQLRVENSAGTLQDIFGYDGTFVPKTEGDMLEPNRGYLVRLSDGQAGTLMVDPSGSESDAASASTASRNTDWTIDVSARVGQARDAINTIGVSPDAGLGIDPVDGHEPPPVGSYVSLAFRAPTQDEKLWRDVRGADGRLHTWTAEVQTNVSGMVTLRAARMGGVPEDKEIWLVDPALDRTHNLRERPQYRFAASGDETAHRLRVLVGTPAAVQQALGRDDAGPQRIELMPSVPNPVRSQALLRYQLPEPTRVTLELYDLLGRRVATLVDDRSVQAGTHAHTWTPGAGTAVSSGTYLLRLRAGDVTRTRRLVVVQ